MVGCPGPGVGLNVGDIVGYPTTQTDEPGLAITPEAQGEHALEPEEPENVFTGHMVVCDAPASENEPAGLTEQAVIPVTAEYVPAAQII